MALSDLKYLGFLAIVSLLFYLLPTGKQRRVWLLAASYYFYYRLSHVYIAVLLSVTALAFYGGLALRAQTAPERKPLLFALLLGTVFMPLFLFKYAGFLLATGASVLSVVHPVVVPDMPLIVPIGISFFTFVAAGYLIDVYLEIIEPEDRPLYFALFLAFFPLVSAGPIERATSFLHQFDLTARFTAANGLAALRLIFWGLFLKLVCADTLSGPVNGFFAAPASTSPLEQLVGMVYFAFYLYSDFAGYTLIALGSARLLGLEVRPNFHQPFLSATLPEFWRNWHISLSSWVRDYLFVPLRMHWRAHKRWGMTSALLVSFIVIGVWHGATWGFLAFGIMHGVMVALSGATLERRNRLWARLRVPPMLLHVARVGITFFLVILTYVVFRANSMGDALAIYKGIFSRTLLGQIHLFLHWFCYRDGTLQIIKFFGDATCLFIVALVATGDIAVRNHLRLERFPKIVQCIAYNAGVVLIGYKFLSGNAAAPFLYYQF